MRGAYRYNRHDERKVHSAHGTKHMARARHITHGRVLLGIARTSHRVLIGIGGAKITVLYGQWPREEGAGTEAMGAKEKGC